MNTNTFIPGKCVKCGKPLKAIGTARANGKKNHDDWDARTLHKKCWKEDKKEEEWRGQVERLTEWPL